MPLQKRIALVGISKQSGKGAGASSPATYGLGVRGGAVFDGGLEQAADSISFASRISTDSIRTAVNPGAAIQTRLWPKSGPLLVYGALGGNVDSGGPTPYTHTITPAADLPYFTVFAQLDTEYHKIVDCKIDMLKISWAERAPVDLEVTFKGVTWTGYTAAFTATTSEVATANFIPPAGLFYLDTGSSTPVAASITGGTITINNNLVPIPLSKAITPDDIFPALQEITYEVSLMPADTVEWRKAYTGTSGGTAPGAFTTYGSFEVKYIIDGNNDIDFTATRVAFTGNYPEADPAGGPAELSLVGVVQKPAGAALTVVDHNLVATL